MLALLTESFRDTVTLIRNHGAIDFLMSPWVVMVSMFDHGKEMGTLR